MSAEFFSLVFPFNRKLCEKVLECFSDFHVLCAHYWIETCFQLQFCFYRKLLAKCSYLKVYFSAMSAKSFTCLTIFFLLLCVGCLAFVEHIKIDEIFACRSWLFFKRKEKFILILWTKYFRIFIGIFKDIPWDRLKN